MYIRNSQYFANSIVIEYSRAPISGGARVGEQSDTSPLPGYKCGKKIEYFRIFLPFNRTNYENSYLMALYREV